MINSLSTETTDPLDTPADDGGLSLMQFERMFLELSKQPAWRARADREMEYVDGNQLDSEVLQAQKAIGMPPAIEPLIGPAIEAVLGLEAKTRTDWRITSDSKGGDDVADALNEKLNHAERQSGADKACSDAFKSQACVGIGWVEVTRETDPFKPFPYRCEAIHRNEICWDFLSKKPDLSDARYLVRRRWVDAAQAKLMFKPHAELIDRCTGQWTGKLELSSDGGTSTTMAMAWNEQRGSSIEEQEWMDSESNRVCLFEVWYRKWVEVAVLKAPNGRVVEYDEANQIHNEAIALGLIQPQMAIVAKMFRSYWMGPHKLHDGPTPYPHQEFPYAPFFGHREDRTNAPFGLVRGMVYLQDNVNSAISKIRWGLSAVRTERTKGAVAYSDEVFRQQIARPDADIVLNAEHMAQQGARFEVFRDFQLNEQQYKMLTDARLGIERASGITSAFSGQRGTATSGLQESTQIEQATQTLASLMDKFKYGRTKVGELLLSLVIKDMIGKHETVTIRGNAVLPDRDVQLNQPSIDADSGIHYLTNDVSRTRLKVALEDVPSTPSFRTQQLAAMSEAFKSTPPQYQPVLFPHLLDLMDVPNKREIIQAIQQAQAKPSPEEEHRKWERDYKDRELLARYNPAKLEAEIKKIAADAVAIGIKSAFGAVQAGQLIAQMPQIAPVADVVLQNAGYQAPNPPGQDPNFPQPNIAVPPGPVNPGDTSPQTPTDPTSMPSSPMAGENQGINTMRQDSVMA